MRTYADKASRKKAAARKQRQAIAFKDKRKEARKQNQLQQMADESLQAKKLQALIQKTIPINDDQQLESEADKMGAKALKTGKAKSRAA